MGTFLINHEIKTNCVHKGYNYPTAVIMSLTRSGSIWPIIKDSMKHGEAPMVYVYSTVSMVYTRTLNSDKGNEFMVKNCVHIISSTKHY